MRERGAGGWGTCLYIDPEVNVHRAVNLAELDRDVSDDPHVVRQGNLYVTLQLDLMSHGAQAKTAE